MTRLFLCLVLCFILGLLYVNFRPAAEAPSEQPAPAAVVRPAALTIVAAAPHAGFPAGLPWAGLLHLSTGGVTEGEPLPDPDPLAFLEKCLQRYNREVKGYSLIMQKQERVAGTLYPREIVYCAFQEQPFSVFMKWQAGARKAQAALYVQGANDDHILVRPAGLLSWLPIMERTLDSPDVKASGRYGIHEFGLKKATERVLGPWRAARAHHTLHVAYEGVYRVPETGDRCCYKLHRTRYEQPEDDGITDLVLYIDTETWLQTGSVLHGADGRLIAEYYFRDIRLNPTFSADQFTGAALKR
jgi:hypothetical protein